MRKLLPFAAFLAVAPGLPSCNDHYGVLQAKQVENRAELVGGPVAMADVGDYLLQNDLIKVNILGPKDSPGPGVFGGSIVDIDIRRDRLGFEGAQGHDRFAELFPVANLLVPFPNFQKDANGTITGSDVKVLKDGSDGKEASIRVEGKGAFLFEALSILHDDEDLLKALFPDVKTAFRFRTDYILRPGERHIVIQSTVMLDYPEDPDLGCPGTASCPTCENGYLADPQTGCYVCTCADAIPLEPYTATASVFGQIFGDPPGTPDAPAVHRAGVIAGDFVFFGNQNNVFAPGIGFDADKALHDAAYAGQNTFQAPLSFDFVTAAGGDVSYGYFTVAAKGAPPTRVNVPIFSGAATAFLAGGKSCLFDTSDDDTCDNKRAWTYERYLAVGDGDVASVVDEVYKTRGTATGTLSGAVQWATTGDPATKAHVYVFADPHPGYAWKSVDELADFARRQTGGYGIVDAVDADVGLDLVLDGDFHATLPAGDYVVVARTEDGMGLSVPQSIHLDAGKTATVVPQVVTPGTVRYRVADEQGNLTPAKVALVSLGDDGKPLEGDGKRRVYLGDSRLGGGVRAYDYSVTGRGEIRVEPGRYLLRASRGPEYGVYEEELTVDAGRLARIDATIVREIDTTGWMSTDTHLHSTPSFDSGMPLPKRLSTIADEHVEFALATDHDVETDYGPTIRDLFLDPYVQSCVSAETTTIEQGHFIGFPLKYNAEVVPTHGSHDPTCETGGEIVAGLKRSGSDPAYDPFVILAHPRDGFFGYMYQLGVDPFTMKRKVSSLEAKNPVFRTATCDFDGMELINGKRFDLVRTPTISEVVGWNRCRARIDAAQSIKDLDGVCPELGAGMLAPCTEAEIFADCRDRNRSRAAWLSTKHILLRTPEEQEAHWGFSMTTADGQTLCDPPKDPAGGVPPEDVDLPCTYYSGHVDDYFRYLEHGMLKTQIAGSDGHDAIHEPGYPRTYFMSPTDAPAALTTKDVVESLRAQHAVTTYGPFISAKVTDDKGDKTFGDVVNAKAGGKIGLDLKVQTASWFGVDRIEIYMNGRLVKLPAVTSKTEDLVDFDGKIDLDVPADRDSWIVVIAMGLEDRNLMRPVSLDVPYGEIQISKVTADAFALVPVVNAIFKPTPTVPDWFPIPAYAVSNPIYIDTKNDGKYDAPLAYPEFCSHPCDGGASTACADGQSCLPDDNQCGVKVLGANACTHRIPWSGGDAPL